MLSTELPITEWWDPEVEYYGVPMSPTGHGPAAEAAWWPAFVHLAEIEWIMTGRTWGWPDGLFARQLEPPRRPPSWYPGQPEPPRRSKRPCTCFYGLRALSGIVQPDNPWGYVRCFVIVFDCPHHGDDRFDREALDEWFAGPAYEPRWRD